MMVCNILFVHLQVHQTTNNKHASILVHLTLCYLDDEIYDLCRSMNDRDNLVE